ncbi:MAG TPA: alkaline phosphatase family protein, partial [Candidatus Dormibacteraeota bacterium]|nr:alkaline phosphatase family protein [Candidatus Dormibacteraeota bacterium]
RAAADHPAAIRVLIAALLIAALLATLLLRTTRPWFDHAYLIVLENHGSDQIIGNTTDAPYLNRLARAYGLATDYEAVAHPSTPDYFTLLAGSTFGIADDARHDIAAPSLFDQLEAHGRTWHVYAKDYPGGCFTGMSATGGPDLGPEGQYVRRHNPAASFTRITSDPGRCANITSMASFDPTAADFEMLVPNDTNNMHDGTIRQADDWLATIVPRILAAPDFAHSVLFITWDEGDTNEGGGGKVPMIVVRPGLGPGFTSPVLHTHRAFLRTIEDGWDLGCLAGACQAVAMSEFFGR